MSKLRPMTRTRIPILLLAVVSLIAALAVTALPAADAAVEDRSYHKRTEADIDLEDTNGTVAGFIADWAPDGSDQPDRTQFRLFVSPDDVEHVGDGERSTGSTEEWSVELYAEGCADRKGYPLAAPEFTNHDKYGPSMNLFVLPAVLERALNGCLLVIHDGPTATRHAIVQGYSGRHVVAEVNIADVLVLR